MNRPSHYLNRHHNHYSSMPVIVALAVSVAPFFKGLFYEKSYLVFLLGIFILFSWWIISGKKRWILHLSLFDIALLLFPAAYLVSVPGSVNTRQALLEWPKYVMYFCIYYFAKLRIADDKPKKTAINIIIGSAVLLGLTGIDGMFGRPFSGFAERVFGVVIPNEIYMERAASTLQYPNTLGILMGAAFLLSCIMAVNSTVRTHDMLYHISAYMLLLSLAFTMSRGAILLLPAAWILMLMAVPVGRKIKFVCFSIVTLLLSVIVCLAVLKLQENLSAVWLVISAGLTVTVVVGCLAARLTAAIDSIGKKGIMILVSIATCLLAGAGILVLSSQVPLVIQPAEGADFEHMKRIYPRGGERYVLHVTADFPEGSELVNDITYRNMDDIYLKRERLLLSQKTKGTGKPQRISMEFELPVDSRVVHIYFDINGCVSSAGCDSASGSDSSSGCNNVLGCDIASGRDSASGCDNGSSTLGCNSNSAILYDTRLVSIDSGKSRDLALKYRFLPTGLSTRLEEMRVPGTLFTRMAYYRDCLKMLAAKPLFGHGGGAWELLYPSYQSYYYRVSNPHGYIASMVVETGFVGITVLLFFAAMLVTAFFKYIKRQTTKESAFLTTGILLVFAYMAIHSTFDADMLFTAFPMMLSLLLGLAAGGMEGGMKSDSALPNRQPPLNKTMERIAQKPIIMFNRHVFILLAVVPALVISSMVAIGHIYHNKSKKAAQNGDIRKPIYHLEKAAAWDRFNGVYKIELASAMLAKDNISRPEFEKIIETLNKAERSVLYNAQLNIRIAAIYMSIGSFEDAFSALEQAVRLAPLEKESWKYLVEGHYNIFRLFLNQGDTEKAYAVAKRIAGISGLTRDLASGRMEGVLYSNDTYKMLEEMEYFTDNINATDATANGTILFYCSGRMDANGNGIADQWELSELHTTKTYDATLTRLDETGPISEQRLESREITIPPGNWQLLIKTVDDENRCEIMCRVTGIDNDTFLSKGDKGIFSAFFTTDKPVDSSRLYIYGVEHDKVEYVVLKAVTP